MKPILTSSEPQSAGTKGQLSDDNAALAVIVDWFACMFIAPPEMNIIELCQSGRTSLFLTEIGEKLQQQRLSRQLLQSLHDNPAKQVQRILSYQYVTLFDGMAGPLSTPPYESFFRNANGRLWQQADTEMRDIMFQLNRTVGQSNEAADHLALQLATLAEALRQKKAEYEKQLFERLLRWVPLLNAAVNRVAPSSFYDNLLSLLTAFLSYSQPLPVYQGSVTKH